jgi:nicotinate-nucleotide pyrophosphorylase (carboxylating)
MLDKTRLAPEALRSLVSQALAEDIGRGDATTSALISDCTRINGEFRTRENCIVAGLPVVHAVYSEIDSRLAIRNAVEDGQHSSAGSTLTTISGSAKSILIGERVALNFLQRMSGIATLTKAYVQALGQSKTRILDTRKTTPGLRILEKYAVVMGGGMNHRMGLYDRIMIKDNHLYLKALEGPGNIASAVKTCRDTYPDLEIEVEVDNLEQLSETLMTRVDYILLDNMSTTELLEAVKIRDRICGQTLLEASGGVTLERLSEIGDIGLDFISVGAVTHSARAVDIGLDLSDRTTYPDTPE